MVSLGLNVVLDIIKDSYQQNPSICIRSLESLSNLLTGLKPESLKCNYISVPIQLSMKVLLTHFLNR